MLQLHIFLRGQGSDIYYLLFSIIIKPLNMSSNSSVKLCQIETDIPTEEINFLTNHAIKLIRFYCYHFTAADKNRTFPVEKFWR